MTAPTVTSGLGQAAIEDAAPQGDDLTCWSVTSILKTIGSSDGLIGWTANTVSAYAIDYRPVWEATLEHEGREAAIAKIAAGRFVRPKGQQRSAAELGSDIHAAIEAWVLDGTRPDTDDEISPFLDQVGDWLDRFQPEWHASEVAVYSPTFGYAGTADGFLTIDGVRCIIDFKTSRDSVDSRGKIKKPWSDVALQLAAYRHAEMAAVWRPRRHEKWRRRYYLLSPEEQAAAVPVPEVDAGLAIHVTPEHCIAYPVRCDEPVHEAFLYAVEAARWTYETSKNVIGTPLEKP